MEETGLIFEVPVRHPKLLGIGKYAAAPDRYSLLLSMKSRLNTVLRIFPRAVREKSLVKKTSWGHL